MASNQQIISDLQLIMEAEQELELLNIYKGVPIVYKATIDDIDEDVVRLKSRDPVMICLEEKERTRILGSDFFDPAVAQVTGFDPQSGTIILDNFSYTGTKLGDRMIVRVEPKDAARVTVSTAGQDSHASMVDISISGVGIRMANSEYSPMLKPGTGVDLSIDLPSVQVKVTGMVLSVTKKDDYYRLSIRFEQQGDQRTTIFKYLIDRRNEIREELEHNYKIVQNA